MGKLLTYLGDIKILKRIADVLNVKDVKVNGSSVVDNSGDAIVTVPTKTSDLQNDSGFITNTVNNLVNYYLKTETYTKTEVDNLIGSISTISFVVVQILPVTDIQTNVIYLVPKQTAQTENIYDEYINTDGTSQGWELIGTTEIDLSNYYTKTEVDNLIPTDFVPKSTGGIFDGNVEIVTANSGTSNVNSRLRLGNDKAVGTVGNTRGVIQIYDQNGYYTNIFASDNERNGSVLLPKIKSGESVLAIIDDVDKAETGERSLIYPPYYRSTPYTYRQVTYTYTSDGTLTANGTATGGNSNFHFRTFAMGLGVKGGKGYHLEGCPNGGSSSTYYIQLTFGDKNNNTLLTVNDYGNGIDVIAPPDTAYISSQFIIRSGVTVNNLSFIPKLTPIDFPTCDKTNAGTYTLKATVDVNGNVTYSWV